jgi:soluble lytic murein transglycosylase
MLNQAWLTLDYFEEIEKWANQYELDPYLVASIIHVESANRETISSNRGAVGLMQIMPETGEWIAEKIGIEFKVEDLKNAETNIQFGCWYLRFLANRFKVRDTMIAAYNGGHTKVSKWLSDSKYSADGDTLLDIPYPETKNYVERVNNAYDKYKKLYPNGLKQ